MRYGECPPTLRGQRANHPVDIDDDDNEILPESIVERNMVFIWSDELLQDTISSAIDQKADASPELILEAINYYDINDDFMTIK